MSEEKFQGNKQTFKNEKEVSKTLSSGGEVRCFDCDCKMIIEEGEIENGSLLVYEDDQEEFLVFKCNECFSKNEGLEDYKECEVYSRIVGYLRPVKQWNEGKKQEYKERKEYDISQGE